MLAQCMSLVQEDDSLPRDERIRASVQYGKLALALLADAIDKGFKEADYLKNAKDLAPLRDSPELKADLASLMMKIASK